jgi:hypothetical protein
MQTKKKQSKMTQKEPSFFLTHENNLE